MANEVKVHLSGTLRVVAVNAVWSGAIIDQLRDRLRAELPEGADMGPAVAKEFMYYRSTGEGPDQMVPAVELIAEFRRG